MIYDEKKVEALKRRYPEGTRICLDSMENDPFPIPSGSRGTVQFVDDAGQLIMKWDNGSSLSVKRHVKHKKRENPKKAVKKQNTPYKLRIYGVYEV